MFGLLLFDHFENASKTILCVWGQFLLWLKESKNKDNVLRGPTVARVKEHLHGRKLRHSTDLRVTYREVHHLSTFYPWYEG